MTCIFSKAHQIFMSSLLGSLESLSDFEYTYIPEEHLIVFKMPEDGYDYELFELNILSCLDTAVTNSLHYLKVKCDFVVTFFVNEDCPKYLSYEKEEDVYVIYLNQERLNFIDSSYFYDMLHDIHQQEHVGIS